MKRIFLLDNRSEIFQSFQDVNQLFAFCNRCSRNLKGKTLIVRNGAKAVVTELVDQSPKEINDLVIKIQNEIK